MQNHEIELSVGDVLQIGERIVTVVDIEGPDVRFHVDKIAVEEISVEDSHRPTRPRK